jgi:ureidoglycolate lyase
VIFQELTSEAFAPFGIVVEAPEAPGRTERMPLPVNSRPAAVPTMTLIHLEAASGPRSLKRMERHRHGGQAFLHLSGGGFLIVAAPTTAGGGPDLARLHVFTSRPGQGYVYHPDIWHAGISASDGPAIVASLICVDGSDGDVEKLTLAEPILLTR